MEQVKWYKRLLCGYNILGDFADLICRGTETQYDLTMADIRNKKVSMRCWCCTFWRGVIVGAVASALVTGAIHAAIHL
jgi:hypothetical protein|nr:MAG TPA: hypothetical protein [Caudoviricetes sp.]